MNAIQMSQPDELETRLHQWMSSGARPRLADAFYEQLGERTEHTRQRPSLLVRTWVGGTALPRTSLLVPALAVLLALVLAVGSIIVGARMLLHDDQRPVLVAPSPSPLPGLTAPPSVSPNASPAVRNGPIVLLISKDPSGAGSPSFTAVAVAPDGSRTTLPIPVQSRSCPTFSPDGRHLAYITQPGGGAPDALQMSDPDGSHVRDLWSGTFNDQTFHQVVWSGDSSRVAATEALLGTPQLDHILIGHVDGSKAGVADRGGEFPGELSWNPIDRDQLAIAGGGLEVYRLGVGVDVGVDETLPINQLAGPPIHAVAWSHDGKVIAYTQVDENGANGSLHFVNADGTHGRVLPDKDGGSDGLLAWSPDGQLLAVAVDTRGGDGSFTIRLVDRDGNDIRTLGPFEKSSNFSFTWSPDSREILLALGSSSIGGGSTGPLIAPIDGSTPRSIGVGPGEFYTQCPLAWQPVFSSDTSPDPTLQPSLVPVATPSPEPKPSSPTPAPSRSTPTPPPVASIDPTPPAQAIEQLPAPVIGGLTKTGLYTAPANVLLTSDTFAVPLTFTLAGHNTADATKSDWCWADTSRDQIQLVYQVVATCHSSVTISLPTGMDCGGTAIHLTSAAAAQAVLKLPGLGAVDEGSIADHAGDMLAGVFAQPLTGRVVLIPGTQPRGKQATECVLDLSGGALPLRRDYRTEVLFVDVGDRMLAIVLVSGAHEVELPPMSDVEGLSFGN